MKKIQGAITAIVTPFQKDGSIDVLALRKLVEWQIKSGIDGLVPCGSTGEAATMDTRDYELVVKTVVDAAAGRVPIIAGATSNNTAQAIENSKIARRAGVDVLLHANPYYNKPTLAGLLAHYGAIAKATDLPIILYNVPGRTGANMSAAITLEIVKKVPHIIGIKEASANPIQIMDIIKGAPSNFSLLSGDDNLVLPIMALGGVGGISVAANEIPKEFTLLVQAALRGDFTKARKMHYEWLDLLNANFIESNPQPVKTALAMMGRVQEVFRLPLVSMRKENKETLRSILRKHRLI